jgi:Flp pilus assembly protein TadG
MLGISWPDDLSPASLHSAGHTLHGRRKRRQRAATTVEFALVAPLFFLMVLGLIELGRGLMVKHLLTNAARQGCRVGVVEGKGNSDINAAVSTVLAPLGISAETVSVQVNDGSGDARFAVAFNELTVKVSVPVSAVTWLPGGRYLSGTLSGQYTLRKE